MQTPTHSAQHMPMSFRAHRQFTQTAALDDSDSNVSPTARKSRGPATPSPNSSPTQDLTSSLSVRRPRFGRRLTFENDVGASDYELTDGEVEAADDGVCAIKYSTEPHSPWHHKSPFKTPVAITTPARTTTSVKRRLTDSGGNIAQTIVPKKPKPMPHTPSENTPASILLTQTNSMRRLSLREDQEPRTRRASISKAANGKAARRTVNIFEHSNGSSPRMSPSKTATRPRRSPARSVARPNFLLSQMSPQPAERPSFHSARVPSQGTILFGGPTIASLTASKPATTFMGTPTRNMDFDFDEPSSPSICMPSSPSPPQRNVFSVMVDSDMADEQTPTLPRKFGGPLDPDSPTQYRVTGPSIFGLQANGTLMTPTSSTCAGASSPAETNWPMLASRERRDVDKQRRSSAVVVSPLKKPMPGTPTKKTGAGFARQWLSTTHLPDRPFAMGPRQSLPLSFPNLALALNTSTPSSRSDVSGEDEDGSPSLRPLARRQSGQHANAPLTRASIGGAPLAGRRATRAFAPLRGGGLLGSSDSSSSDNDVRAESQPRQRPLPIRRPYDSSSEESESDEPFQRDTPTRPVLSLPRLSIARGNTDTPKPAHAYVHFALAAAGAAKKTDVDGEPGRLQRGYAEVSELGRGEFGAVLKARRRSDGTWCAIKRSKTFEGVKHRLRVREEADILRQLTDVGESVNVLQFHSSWEQDTQLFIETELCSFGSFAKFLGDFGQVRDHLDEARVWKVIADVGEGLRFVHAAGVIHLDIKPANILVGSDGRLRIADFGMAAVWPRPADDDTIEFEREGDRVYMAPEVLQGVYGPAADVFSLGLVVLEAATNIIVPDSGDGWHRLRSEDLSIVVHLGAQSAPLQRLLQALMRADPANRPSMEDVCRHPVVRRVRARMDAVADVPTMPASPLHPEPDAFLREVLDGCEEL